MLVVSAERTPPNDPALLAQCAEAAQKGGGWVYEIDGTQVRDAKSDVPPQAIKGAWQVGPDGKVTGAYRANPNYKPAN